MLPPNAAIMHTQRKPREGHTYDSEVDNADGWRPEVVRENLRSEIVDSCLDPCGGRLGSHSICLREMKTKRAQSAMKEPEGARSGTAR